MPIIEEMVPSGPVESCDEPGPPAKRFEACGREERSAKLEERSRISITTIIGITLVLHNVKWILRRDEY